ncbi:glutathione peroxidase [Marinitenerispora sediminis]|uniref:Glutathione peroxidase n=1 Tax=Marinitenerispora sediminis TaxID=1931232 RepID=A0A368T5A0_9ACTN|nr:glutathione peroxidase [Marinitenerispora sediminis]RCV57278.1 glutathione peroxidase [Marinitenerispora sediminis]RCV58261.1 glutathione peroxidase [Marinitenerispora sediminis]RCV58482.1 glutathione peroxidase [Marinitenerispora sediminis]
MSIHDIALRTLEGEAAALPSDRLLLIVNVASKCGLTPQYAGLERLHERYAERGFSVVGVPCDQFMGQEPGSPAEIREFCSLTYGVTFPMLAKTEVNGADRHPLYAELTRHPDTDGEAGDVQWNFEKFLVAPDGTVLGRYRPATEPEDPRLVRTIEQHLPS